MRVSSITLPPGAQAMNSQRARRAPRGFSIVDYGCVFMSDRRPGREKARSGVFAGFPSAWGTSPPLQATTAILVYVHSFCPLTLRVRLLFPCELEPGPERFPRTPNPAP